MVYIIQTENMCYKEVWKNIKRNWKKAIQKNRINDIIYNENRRMKKSYKIDVDCANCANKMEVAANNTEGVKNAVVNFMMLKMNVEFEDGVQPKEVMARVLENCKKVEDDCEIFF